jgi:Na+/H+ antiporter NhaC
MKNPLVILALMIAFAVLVFVAAAVASGINPSVLSDGLIFLVVVAFVVAAIFEIKRLADQP